MGDTALPWEEDDTAMPWEEAASPPSLCTPHHTLSLHAPCSTRFRSAPGTHRNLLGTFLEPSCRYSCVAPSLLERGRLSQQLPGNMRQVAQRRRWVLPLPAAFACLPAAELPSPDGGSGGTRPEGVTSQSVQYVRRPSMRRAAV